MHEKKFSLLNDQDDKGYSEVEHPMEQRVRQVAKTISIFIRLSFFDDLTRGTVMCGRTHANTQLHTSTHIYIYMHICIYIENAHFVRSLSSTAVTEALTRRKTVSAGHSEPVFAL
jgi:hypothetical protein